MLPNGNYEEVISFIQHECVKDYGTFRCVEYGNDRGNLHFKIEEEYSDEDRFSYSLLVNYCPFCGYQPEPIKSNA